MKGSVAVVSDMHVNAMRDSEQNRRAEKFIEFCTGRFDTLILLGDTFDFYFSYGSFIPERLLGFVNKMRAFARTGRIIIFRGNHDYWLGTELFDEDCNYEIIEDYAVMNMFGKEYLLMHGDRPGKLSTWEKLRDSMLHSKAGIALFSILPPAIAYRLGRYVSLLTENGSSAANLVHNLHRRIPTHEKWNRSLITMTGHVHSQFRSDDGRFIITGDFKNKSVYLVINEQGEQFEYF